MSGWRIVRDTDNEQVAPVIVMKSDQNTGGDLIANLRSRLNENRMLEDFFKDLDKKKDTKPKKIAVGLSGGEVFALMIISAFPIVAASSTVMSWCMAIIKSNVHEMFK